MLFPKVSLRCGKIPYPLRQYASYQISVLIFLYNNCQYNMVLIFFYGNFPFDILNGFINQIF